MSATSADRQAVYESREPVLGEQAALRLMDHHNFTPERELASTSDLMATTAALEGSMAELRGELRGEMAELRGEMTELRSELRGEMTELRAELRGEMAQLRADVNVQIAGLQRWAAGILAANGVALAAALLT